MAPIDCIFIDVVGQMITPSLVNEKYFVTLLEDSSEFSMECIIRKIVKSHMLFKK